MEGHSILLSLTNSTLMIIWDNGQKSVFSKCKVLSKLDVQLSPYLWLIFAVWWGFFCPVYIINQANMQYEVVDESFIECENHKIHRFKQVRSLTAFTVSLRKSEWGIGRKRTLCVFWRFLYCGILVQSIPGFGFMEYFSAFTYAIRVSIQNDSTP